MAVHKPWDRPFFVLGGSVMKNGFSLNLAEGQFGIFNMSKQTKKGSTAVENFLGLPKDTMFELKLGHNRPGGRSLSDKNFSSFPFRLKDVLGVRVSAPVRSEDLVDELIIGYDGIDATKSIQLKYGEEKEIAVKLSGKALEYIGAPGGQVVITVPLSAPAPVGDECTEVDICAPVDMLPIIKDAVEQIKGWDQFGVNIDNFMEVTPVIKLTGAAAGTPGQLLYTHTINVNDTGDAIALALVQQQYPGEVVVRESRTGITSVYKITSTTASLVDYTQSIKSVLATCDTCPEEFSLVEGGYLYAIEAQDNGDMLPTPAGAVNFTKNGQVNGVGFYTFVAPDILDDAALQTIIKSFNFAGTVALIGDVKAICENKAITTLSWTTDDTSLESTVDTYKIVIPDNECGNSRLAELQAAYADLVITETGVTGGCQREYKTTVNSNFVGEQCDPIFKDTFSSEAPESFDGYQWKKVEVAVDGTTGLYGIRFKAKKFKLASGEVFREKIGYTEDSVEIQAAGGYIRDFNLGVNYLRNIKDTPYAVTYLSKKTPRTHVAGRMLGDEKVAKAFFSGMHIDYDYMGRILTNNESKIVNLDAQVVDYVISLRRDTYAQGLSQRVEENIDYHVIVEVGEHKAVEEVINKLAGAAGVDGVAAFGFPAP